MPEDISILKEWVGKTEEKIDLITAWPLAALSATLNRNDPQPYEGSPVPWPWHWLYFLETPLHSKLSNDGHQGRGDFLPAVTLPRRMWAGGRMSFHQPLLVGQQAVRKSTILDVSGKQGKAGELVFVVVLHEIFVGDALVMAEEHDIVYREEAKPDDIVAAPLPAPAKAQWSRTIQPDEALLFRYSALTFNGHRIHYDLDYCRDEEGYPGLVVHGPLTATLLLDLVRREYPEREITGFDYRATRPLFAIGDYQVQGRFEEGANEALVWALDSEGALCMKGTVKLR
ncbi:MAG: MaoC family dehydratase N-terminal domain-containing protein [Alphaproteobacteria bacterium]|nr:MaoC family dehydratase N-terminal domain-containing protein [Rhodospirillales bacterium]MCW9044931.1 MaoC family dehydratase N-terminal domain-containing protein [Alphaproteobacteria bacterium]